MANDTSTIETMLEHYAAMLREKAEELWSRTRAYPASHSPHHARSIEAAMDLEDAVEAVDAERRGLTEARQADDLTLFAGSWPPSNPLHLLAMCTTLLADIDDLPTGDYLGEGEGIPHGVVGKAWEEVNAALHSLTPNTPEAATAIHLAWQADEELGFGDAWEERQVEEAMALAWPHLPRSL